MCEKQNNVPVAEIESTGQVAEPFSSEEKQELREYYLRQLRLMCPTMSGDKPDYAKLAILQKRTSRLVEMLTLFEHSWMEEVPVLQKACLSYLATETLPRKERQQLIDAWAVWSDFQFKLARYRGQLGKFLQYHHCTWQELESLLNPKNAEASPEIQKVD